MGTKHVLVADSSSLTVVGAETLLRQRAETRVSTASCASELLQMAQDSRPDVILMGDQLDPDTDTFELVHQVVQTAPGVRLILIGSSTSGLFIRDLFTLGVCGYLATGDDLREALLTAVDTVLRDRPYLSPTANSEYLIAMQTGEHDWKLDAEARSILRLLAQGYTVGAIAVHLKMKARRVYWVREKLRRRFGAVTNEHLISRAAAEGFCNLTD